MSEPIDDVLRHSILIPLVLSRQEFADMIGTTIETSIRIMSRWGKDGVVRTDKDGFSIVDRAALEAVAAS
jgi:CRP/FNR family transcriptional regulator, nitrogen oxide reductase regulator